jgi:hypothetical protein
MAFRVFLVRAQTGVMVEMPAGELRGRDAAGHGVEQAEDAVPALAGHRQDGAVHYLVQQHREIEHSESGDDGKRQPEIPLVQVHDGRRAQHQHSDVGERHEGVQQRPLLMQLTQRLGRNLPGQVALELLGVVGVISHRSVQGQTAP